MLRPASGNRLPIRNRQLHDERGPPTQPPIRQWRRRRYADAAAVLSHDGVRNGEAEARALPHVFRCEERVENLALHIDRYAGPVVGHLEGYGVSIEVMTGREHERPAAVR